jgi:DNA-binding MurR/RpiR family transcriptional regulator
VSKTATKSRSVKSLCDYISERFDEFSRSQKDVARYIVDHLDEAAFQTAEELARRANTSSSTVVRFSQALGFEGYPELQQAAIEEYRHRQPNDNGKKAQPLFSFDHSEFEDALSADHANVEETARKLTRDQINAAIQAVAGAEGIVIVGVEQMAFFASYLRHLLGLLDIRADIVSSASREGLARLGRVEEGWLVIMISAGRAHPLVMRALKLARHRNAGTLTVSDATLSDSGAKSDLSLYYSANSPSFVRSNAALMSLVQAVAYGVYSRDEARHKDRIRAYKLK